MVVWFYGCQDPRVLLGHCSASPKSPHHTLHDCLVQDQTLDIALMADDTPRALSKARLVLKGVRLDEELDVTVDLMHQVDGQRVQGGQARLKLHLASLGGIPHHPKTGKEITIESIHVVSLTHPDKDRKMYVKCNLGRQVMETALQDGPMPSWQEPFTFAVSDEVRQSLDVALRDSKKGSMGKARVRIDALWEGVLQDVPIRLLSRDSCGEWVSGDPPNQLKITVQARGFGQRVKDTGNSEVVGYTDSYQDAHGLRPGEQGFTPPAIGPLRYDPQPLSAGCYNQNYMDANLKRPGERGFIPPLRGVSDPQARAEKASGLFNGYDADYRDPADCAPGDDGFVAPYYQIDAETGQIPPVPGMTEGELPYGAYGDSYRDVNMRQPGETGFLAPLQQQRSMTPREVTEMSPEGYDELFVDVNGCMKGDPAFVGPGLFLRRFTFADQPGLVMSPIPGILSSDVDEDVRGDVLGQKGYGLEDSLSPMGQPGSYTRASRRSGGGGRKEPSLQRPGKQMTMYMKDTIGSHGSHTFDRSKGSGSDSVPLDLDGTMTMPLLPARVGEEDWTPLDALKTRSEVEGPDAPNVKRGEPPMLSSKSGPVVLQMRERRKDGNLYGYSGNEELEPEPELEPMLDSSGRESKSSSRGSGRGSARRQTVDMSDISPQRAQSQYSTRRLSEPITPTALECGRSRYVSSVTEHLNRSFEFDQDSTYSTEPGEGMPLLSDLLGPDAPNIKRGESDMASKKGQQIVLRMTERRGLGGAFVYGQEDEPSIVSEAPAKAQIQMISEWSPPVVGQVDVRDKQMLQMPSVLAQVDHSSSGRLRTDSSFMQTETGQFDGDSEDVVWQGQGSDRAVVWLENADMDVKDEAALGWSPSPIKGQATLGQSGHCTIEPETAITEVEEEEEENLGVITPEHGRSRRTSVASTGQYTSHTSQHVPQAAMPMAIPGLEEGEVEEEMALTDDQVGRAGRRRMSMQSAYSSVPSAGEVQMQGTVEYEVDEDEELEIVLSSGRVHEAKHTPEGSRRGSYSQASGSELKLESQEQPATAIAGIHESPRFDVGYQTVQLTSKPSKRPASQSGSFMKAPSGISVQVQQLPQASMPHLEGEEEELDFGLMTVDQRMQVTKVKQGSPSASYITELPRLESGVQDTEMSFAAVGSFKRTATRRTSVAASYSQGSGSIVSMESSRLPKDPTMFMPGLEKGEIEAEVTFSKVDSLKKTHTRRTSVQRASFSQASTAEVRLDATGGTTSMPEMEAQDAAQRTQLPGQKVQYVPQTGGQVGLLDTQDSPKSLPSQDSARTTDSGRRGKRRGEPDVTPRASTVRVYMKDAGFREEKMPISEEPQDVPEAEAVLGELSDEEEVDLQMSGHQVVSGHVWKPMSAVYTPEVGSPVRREQVEVGEVGMLEADDEEEVGVLMSSGQVARIKPVGIKWTHGDGPCTVQQQFASETSTIMEEEEIDVTCLHAVTGKAAGRPSRYQRVGWKPDAALRLEATGGLQAELCFMEDLEEIDVCPSSKVGAQTGRVGRSLRQRSQAKSWVSIPAPPDCTEINLDPDWEDHALRVRLPARRSESAGSGSRSPQSVLGMARQGSGLYLAPKAGGSPWRQPSPGGAVCGSPTSTATQTPSHTSEGGWAGAGSMSSAPIGYGSRRPSRKSLNSSDQGSASLTSGLPMETGVAQLEGGNESLTLDPRFCDPSIHLMVPHQPLEGTVMLQDTDPEAMMGIKRPTSWQHAAHVLSQGAARQWHTVGQPVMDKVCVDVVDCAGIGVLEDCPMAVEITCGLQTRTTSFKQATVTPVWNERFVFILEDGPCPVELLLMNNRGDELGRACVELEGMPLNARQESTLRLRQKVAAGGHTDVEPPVFLRVGVIPTGPVPMGTQAVERGALQEPQKSGGSLAGVTGAPAGPHVDGTLGSRHAETAPLDAELEGQAAISAGVDGTPTGLLAGVPPLPLPSSPCSGARLPVGVDGTYGPEYRDVNNRKPGDAGFIPPITGIQDAAKRATKAAGLPEGFDAEYRDANGRGPQEPGFVPPCYTASYVDVAGRGPGDTGFLPPCAGGRAQPLRHGEYDSAYRDANGRKPGETGFIPPLEAANGRTAQDMARRYPEGYDARYVDAEGRTVADDSFCPPVIETPGAVKRPQAGQAGKEVPKELAVKLMGATSLSDGDAELEPIIVFHCGGEVGKSKVSESGAKPEFKFSVGDLPDESVEVVLLHPVTREAMGEARIPLSELQQGRKEVAVPLYRRDKKTGKWKLLPSGSALKLQLEPQGFGQPSGKRLHVEMLTAMLSASVEVMPMYITAVLGNNAQKTSLQPPSRAPKFNESFEFAVTDEENETLNVTLLGENGQMLGMYRLKINSLEEGERQEITPKLYNKNAAGQWVVPDIPSSVSLAVTSQGFGKAPKQGEVASTIIRSYVPQAAGFSPQATQQISMIKLDDLTSKSHSGSEVSSHIPDIHPAMSEGSASHTESRNNRPLLGTDMSSATTTSTGAPSVVGPDGTYGREYRDVNNRKPGDAGFIPPITGIQDAAKRATKAAGLPEGFDAEYRDANGHGPQEPGFVPPCYTASYVDVAGRGPGDTGFLPPCAGGRAQPLRHGEYDSAYRDANGRKPGETGFIPPLEAANGRTAQDMARRYPEGYDAWYVDAEGRTVADDSFCPPVIETPGAVKRPQAGQAGKKVSVKVIGAPSLCDGDAELEPIIVFRCGGEVGKSKVSESGAKPEFKFSVGDLPDESVEVVLLHPVTREAMGEARIPLSELQQGRSEVSVPLFTKDAQTGVWKRLPSGKSLRLQLEPQGFGQPSGKRLHVEIQRAMLAAPLEVMPMYIKATLGNQVQKTAVQPGSRAPKFNESFEFAVTDEENETLNVTLLGENGQMLGMYRLKINSLEEGERQEITSKLYNKNAAGQWVVPDIPSRVSLAFTSQGFGKAPKPGSEVLQTTQTVPRSYSPQGAGFSSDAVRNVSIVILTDPMPPPTSQEIQQQAGHTAGTTTASTTTTSTRFHSGTRYDNDLQQPIPNLTLTQPSVPGGTTGETYHTVECTYGPNYVNANGRNPGDVGFIPPFGNLQDPSRQAVKAAGLPEGFDADYRDSKGRSPHDAGFEPPCYTSSNQDAASRHPGDAGFLSPTPDSSQAQPLKQGQYDSSYRDANFRKPGEKGFILPLEAAAGRTVAEMTKKYPDGYDEHYMDSKGLTQSHPRFTPSSIFGTPEKPKIYTGKRLHVDILKATIPDVAHTTYMNVEVGKQLQSTAVQPASSNPTFSESFEFVVSDEEVETLNLTLCNDQHNVLGMYRLKINSLEEGVRQEVTPKLFKKSASGQWVVPDSPTRLTIGVTSQVCQGQHIGNGGPICV